MDCEVRVQGLGFLIRGVTCRNTITAPLAPICTVDCEVGYAALSNVSESATSSGCLTGLICRKMQLSRNGGLLISRRVTVERL